MDGGDGGGLEGVEQGVDDPGFGITRQAALDGVPIDPQRGQPAASPDARTAQGGPEGSPLFRLRLVFPSRTSAAYLVAAAFGAAFRGFLAVAAPGGPPGVFSGATAEPLAESPEPFPSIASRREDRLRAAST